jgi:hypothetical protein
MQPYFFPYVGYFALIAQCDEWEVFDISQFTRKSWMTRNRILNPNKPWVYVNAPVIDRGRGKRTCEIQLKNRQALLADLLNKLSHYQVHAPCYEAVVAMVRRSIEAVPEDSLTELNLQTMRGVCDYLGIPFRYRVSSREPHEYEIAHAGSWALEISKRRGAAQYLNPIGGRDLFVKEEFDQSGIELMFLQPHSFEYDTGPYPFESGLSILDALMWNPPEKVRDALMAHAVIAA